MAYYDQIAKQWHKATGYQGGSFKKYVLNDVLLREMTAVADLSILELGAGNGYFMPLALDYYSGQVPQRITISDGSAQLLSIAETHFFIPDAEYLWLDVRSPFPFADAKFDLILATMIFNEVSTGGLRRALMECRRTLRSPGLLLITITHPDFVASLERRSQLKRNKQGILTMPGAGQLRLPVVPRQGSVYERLLARSGFAWEKRDLYPTEEVTQEKTGLRALRCTPLALVLRCWPIW